jgi:hypothetical protein
MTLRVLRWGWTLRWLSVCIKGWGRQVRHAFAARLLTRRKLWSWPCIRNEVLRCEDVYRSGSIPGRYMEVSGHLESQAVLSPARSPGTHWIWEWVGIRAGLDATLLPGIETLSSVRSHLLCCDTFSKWPAKNKRKRLKLCFKKHFIENLTK